MNTYNWQGASGRWYEFEIARAQRAWEPVGGIYMFVKPHDQPSRDWGGPICLFYARRPTIFSIAPCAPRHVAGGRKSRREGNPSADVKDERLRARGSRGHARSASADPEPQHAAPRGLSARRHRRRRKIAEHAIDAGRVERAQLLHRDRRAGA